MKKLSIFIVVLVLALFFGCDSGTDSPKPPQVSILQPADGDTLSGAYSIIVTATGDNGIDYIRFFLDEETIGYDNTDPYELEIDTGDITNGIHEIYCMAMDNDGLFSYSDTLSVLMINSPFAGVWEMNNLNQTSTFTAESDVPSLGITTGMVLGASTMDWSAFSALGVSATVNLYSNGTFIFHGNLAVESDTLGYLPYIVPLADQGTWMVDENMNTFTLDGAVLNLMGEMTVDNSDYPSYISITERTSTVRMVVIMVDVNQDGIPDLFVPDVSIREDSIIMMGFSRGS